MVRSPIEIFEELSEEFEDTHKFKKGLWPAQEECLKLYFNKLKDRNKIGIKLPTGAGKTLLGLLILKMWLEEGKNVAIITWTNALAQRIEQECHDLKVEAVRIWGKYSTPPDPRREEKKFLYSDAEAIGIFTYATYLESDIGADPDILIIDDADLFIDHYTHYFHFSFKRDEFLDIYNEILEDLDENYYLNIRTFKEQRGQFNTSIELVHFVHANKLIKRIIESFDPVINRLDRFNPTRIGYERNRSKLDLFLMFVSNQEITLQPFIIFLNSFKRIKTVKQIILMSATLNSLEILQKNFGYYLDDFEMITENDLENQSNTMGKRIIFPIDDCDIMRKTGYGLSAIKKIASQFNKTLILSYSKPQALEILNYLNKKGVNSILYKSINDEVNFKNNESIKCLIVANRYNGLDFPSKICNTCIITNLPIIMTPQDSFCFNVLEDINETHEKTANRIIQGVGRCNRELSDKSIYFILDDTMKTEMSRGDLLKYFPKQLIAELRLGFMDSEFGKLEDAIKIGLDFLNDKYKDYDLKIETQFKKAEKYESVQRDPHFRLEIEAWHYLINNNFENAVSIFEKLLSKYDDTKSGLIKKAWFYYLAAFCYYKLFESIKDEKYKDLYEEKLRICSNCNAHPIFNKAYTVKIQKEEKIVKEEVSEKEINLLKDWVKNPHSLFRRSWFSPEIQKFQLSIKSGLRTLANGEYESASRTFPVDIEKILKELVVNYGDASKLKSKPTFIDYINNLWSKRVIRDHIHKRGIKGDYSITSLRNLILHGKESTENLTEAVIYIMNFISFIDDLIYDTQIFRVLFNELGKIEYIPEIEKIRSFKILDSELKVEKIIRYWAEETEQFLIFEEALETIKDIKHFRITLKITKDRDKIKIQINV